MSTWDWIYCNIPPVGLLCSWFEIRFGGTVVNEITYPLINHQSLPWVIVGWTSDRISKPQKGPLQQNPMITIGKSRLWVIKAQHETAHSHTRN